MPPASAFHTALDDASILLSSGDWRGERGLEATRITRLLVAAIAPFWVLFIAIYTAIYGWTSGAPIIIGCGLLWLSPLALLRLGISPAPLHHLMSASLYIALFLLGWTRGGLIIGLQPWAALIPFTAIMLDRRHAAVAWTLLVVAQYAILFALNPAGPDLPGSNVATAISLLVMLGFVLALTLALDEARRAAERERLRIEGRLERGVQLDGLGRLAGGVAHDLNNILTVVLGNAQLGLAESVGGPAARDLDAIQRAAKRGAESCASLLTMTRGNRGRRRSSEGIDELISGMMLLMDRLMPDAVSVRLDLEVGPDIRAAGNVAAIEHLLLDYILAARDALGDAGDLLIRTTRRTVGRSDLGADAPGTGRYLVIEVLVDARAAAAEAVRASGVHPIGDRPTHQSTTLDADGRDQIGLGALDPSLFREQAKQASAWLLQLGSETEGGRGRQGVEIWLGDASRRVDERAGTQPMPAIAPANRATRVLCVDDQPQVLRLCRRILQASGLLVKTAGSGPEAIAILVADPSGYDVILSDVVMPAMTGPAMVRELREAGCNLPVAFMSGYTSNALDGLDIESEAALLVRKPFQADQLVEAVRLAASVQG